MFNKCIFCGRLTDYLEIKRTAKDIPYINATIAVDRDFKDKKADFISFTAWNKSAEYLYNYAEKGTLIVIVGQYRIDKYQSADGEERKKHYINVDSVKIISGFKPKPDLN